jgi:amino acid efflux transporter
MPDETRLGGLKRAIKLRNAVALYASSVLGSGVLILPGLAAQIAGPASILAWIFLSLASYPFAYTFASLSARRPESGGIYSFAKEAFGPYLANATGWLFALWVITGAPAVTLIAASYLGFAFPLTRPETLLIAFGIFATAFLVNYGGIVVSNKVQLAVIASIVTLLVVTIISSSFLVKFPQNFAPFFPDGFLPIGTAAALIFWSYLGYENVSNVAEEFENPERDFRRSIILSVLLISGLYVAVSFMTIGTLAYRTGSRGSVASFAVMLSHVLGSYGAAGTAILAVFIIFGTENAYTTGMSRVFYAVARDGGFPAALAHVNKKSRVPDRALIALFVSTVPVFLFYYFFNVNLETALLIPSGAAILVYIIGSAAGIRIFSAPKQNESGEEQRRVSGKTRIAVILACISLTISIVILPFVGILLAASFATIFTAVIYTRLRMKHEQEKS